jgi:chromosome segregation ATPase
LEINKLNSEITSLQKEKENLNDKINEIDKKIKVQEMIFKIQLQGEELTNDKKIEIIIKEAEKLKKENLELKERNNSDIKAITEEKQNLEKKCEKFEKENFELTSKINKYISEIKLLKEKFNDNELKSYETIIKIKEEDYKVQINNYYTKYKKINEMFEQKESEYKNIIEEKDKSISYLNKVIEQCKNRNKELIKKLLEFKNKK